jgi:hypothetical protein
LQHWRSRLQQHDAPSVYAFLSAATLWPVVEAARGGDWTALTVLGGVLAGVGNNVLANRIQQWRDEADAARQIAADVAAEPALQAELDAVLINPRDHSPRAAGLIRIRARLVRRDVAR